MPQEAEPVRSAALLYPEPAAAKRELGNRADFDELGRLVSWLGHLGESDHGLRVVAGRSGAYPPKVGFFNGTRRPRRAPLRTARSREGPTFACAKPTRSCSEWALG
jgi:hypothetical protein